MKKLIVLSAFLCAVFFSSCDKDVVEPIATITKTDMLINGTWKISAAVSDNDNNGTYEEDDYASFPDCFRDNFFTFKNTFQFEMNEGPTKCDPADEQTETETWAFANNETTLVIGPDAFTITDLSNTTLKIKQVLPGIGSAVITFTKR